MPEDLRRPIGLRRLALIGSVGLFALAIVRAQAGCLTGDAEPEPSAPVTTEPAPEPRASIEVAPAEPAPAEPAPVEPAVEPAVPANPSAPEDPTPVGIRDASGRSGFIGASKSGFVMEPPRQKKNAATQQAQTPPQPAPQQQNARPGS